jgi:hypothetical protein
MNNSTPSYLKTKMSPQEYTELLCTPIYDDNGDELWYCSYCNEYEPRENFYKNVNSSRGFHTYCKETQKFYNLRSKQNLENSNLPDKHLARQILERLGYDTTKDVHEQFMERLRKKGITFS